MASSNSEGDGGDYDDDFEVEEEVASEASDEDAQGDKEVLSLEVSAEAVEAAAPPRPVPSPSGRRPRRPRPADAAPAAAQEDGFASFASDLRGSQAGAEVPAARLSSASGTAGAGEAPLGRMGSFGEAFREDELGGRTISSSSSASRRLVRGKVSVAAEDRPGTGESHASGAAPAPPVKDSRPLWLQHDDKARKPPSGSRLPLDADAWPEPPRSSAGGSRARPSPRPERGALLGEDDERTGGADDARKIKRLQQEIQRLSQRVAEGEMYSVQDDGLPKFSLDEVEVGLMIAQGGFSSVHHASWQSTPCALKKIFDPVLTDELKAEFENEVRMLRRLRHPNVVTLMAVCRTPPALSILTEFVAGGSLYEVLHSPPSSRPRGAPDCEPGIMLPMVRQAASALAYLHAMMVVHRDIKSQNVLLTEGNRPQAKICDFGLARMRSELCTGSMQYAGTAPYMAPELFAKKRYDEKVDVFAFGTMIWEVVSTEIPHANLDAPDIAHRVTHKDVAGLPLVHSWPKSLKSLLRSTLSVDTDKRPAMTQVAKELEGIIFEFPLADM
eukprot:TRINITY_DN53798_c0_g1_i1.p1 TRINITY_DN53798_c0_g1~~TRINITY_DN53798_c0_g1_i1.p1  ORF type:complete len:573 (+),score=127.70 TRINITY_DN53798_c0_g1_i1:53-1720(+)